MRTAGGLPNECAAIWRPARRDTIDVLRAVRRVFPVEGGKGSSTLPLNCVPDLSTQKLWERNSIEPLLLSGISAVDPYFSAK